MLWLLNTRRCEAELSWPFLNSLHTNHLRDRKLWFRPKCTRKSANNKFSRRNSAIERSNAALLQWTEYVFETLLRAKLKILETILVSADCVNFSSIASGWWTPHEFLSIICFWFFSSFFSQLFHTKRTIHNNFALNSFQMNEAKEIDFFDTKSLEQNSNLQQQKNDKLSFICTKINTNTNPFALELNQLPIMWTTKSRKKEQVVPQTISIFGILSLRRAQRFQLTFDLTAVVAVVHCCCCFHWINYIAQTAKRTQSYVRLRLGCASTTQFSLICCFHYLNSIYGERKHKILHEHTQIQ